MAAATTTAGGRRARSGRGRPSRSTCSARTGAPVGTPRLKLAALGAPPPRCAAAPSTNRGRSARSLSDADVARPPASRSAAAGTRAAAGMPPTCSSTPRGRCARVRYCSSWEDVDAIARFVRDTLSTAAREPPPRPPPKRGRRGRRRDAANAAAARAHAAACTSSRSSRARRCACAPVDHVGDGEGAGAAWRAPRPQWALVGASGRALRLKACAKLALASVD